MTTPLLPDVILDLFQDEVKKINKSYIAELCKIYNIDFEEACQKMEEAGNISFTLVDNQYVKLVKKHKPVEDNERCHARIYSQKDLIVAQCSRQKRDETNFCRMHAKMRDEGRLKYGTIHDKTPEEISDSKLKSKKKFKLL